MYFKPKRKPGLPKSLPLSIDDLSDDGRGIGRYKGKTVFVRGALPQEQVHAEVYADHSKYGEAQVTTIEQPSPDRVESACDYFPRCGGCELHHLKIDEQRSHKEAVLLRQLKRFGDVEPEQILTSVVSDWSGYRQRSRVSLVYDKRSQRVLVGFRRKRDRQIVPVQDCVVLEPKLASLLPSLSELCNRMEGRKELGHIELVSAGDVPALVLRVTSALSEHDTNLWMAFAAEVQVNLYLQAGRALGAKKGSKGRAKNDVVQEQLPVQGQRAQLIYEVGPQSYNLSSFQLTLNYHPQDFVQANKTINEQMVALAMELLALHSEDKALDLFCGLGNFSLPMAKSGASITGVEVSEYMVGQATVNAQQNDLQETVKFLTANLSKENWFKPLVANEYNKMLLDPPRDGAKQIVEAVDKFKQLNSIVYVSCNPATLARDAGILKDKGFRLKKVGLLDMFPQTAHMEAIAHFEKC